MPRKLMTVDAFDRIFREAYGTSELRQTIADAEAATVTLRDQYGNPHEIKLTEITNACAVAVHGSALGLL